MALAYYERGFVKRTRPIW